MKRILALLICLLLPLLSGCDRGLDYEMLGDNWVPDIAGDVRVLAWELVVEENTVPRARVAVETGETIAYEAYVGFQTEEGVPQQAEGLITAGDLYALAEAVHAWLSEHDKAHFAGYTLTFMPPAEAGAALAGFFEESEGVAQYSLSGGWVDRSKAYAGELPYGAVVSHGSEDGALSWVFLPVD